MDQQAEKGVTLYVEVIGPDPHGELGLLLPTEGREELV